MRSQRPKAVIQQILSSAGVVINGDRPWDIRVSNDDFYARVLSGGAPAIGDSYVDGWWDSDRLDELVCRVFRAGAYKRFESGLRAKALIALARILNRQTLRRSRRVADMHYNLGNDLFRAMLGRTMAYTCAYWKGARNLDEAQEAKLDLVCRKLELRPGMTVLEYGCGWGTFARFAAANYGVKVLGINIAEEQVKFGREVCRGLPVELRVQDYRQVEGSFDRVVSIGIMEHIGPKNHRGYMENAARRLKDDGIAFVHTIGRNESAWRIDPWFDRNIFPNGVIPSLRQLSGAMEGLFVMEDCHNIGPNYDPTLLAWHENLSRHWPQFRQAYGERFYRMMKYYLLSSAGAFRARELQLFQMVMTKPGRLQPDCRVEPRSRRESALPGSEAGAL